MGREFQIVSSYLFIITKLFINCICLCSTLHEATNVTVAIYNHNMIMADDEVCRGAITPSQFVEGGKVTNWFPLQPKGEINLNILLY